MQSDTCQYMFSIQDLPYHAHSNEHKFDTSFWLQRVHKVGKNLILFVTYTYTWLDLSDKIELSFEYVHLPWPLVFAGARFNV